MSWPVFELDHRFRHLALETLGELSLERLFLRALVLELLRGLQADAHILAHLRDVVVAADRQRELVVDLGQHLGLDLVHRDVEAGGLADVLLLGRGVREW